MEPIKIQRALLSVSDKSGLTPFAQGLVDAGVTLFSTGGTRRHLENEGIPVKDITEYTNFPEMMEGRLKTLHPKVAGGILCRHDNPKDMDSAREHGIEPFGLIVVNLYPFEATVAREGVTFPEAIEQIDIGGPTMVRAAAKNHKFVTIVTDPLQYAEVLEQVAASGGTTEQLRRNLAAAAFERTASYDRAIADYFSRTETTDTLPVRLSWSLVRQAELRYGENPHQRAALYADPGAEGPNLVTARQLSGKELSYNNLLDLDSALAIARSLPDCGVAVLKHNNPCGAASHYDSLAEAARLAMEGDPVSAFGSILGLNKPVDAATAEVLAAPGNFIEAIVAPQFEKEALEILTTKPKWKANVRLLEVGPLEGPGDVLQPRHIQGGLLVQDVDSEPDTPGQWQVVTSNPPTDEQLAELRFAWAVCRHVKSNAIVLCQNRSLVGVGAGQMSRVDSVEISIRKAGDRAKGSVLASDAFFPFDDSIHTAAAAGVTAIIQPGGSRRDDEVIAACDQHGIAMVFTGKRHFKH